MWTGAAKLLLHPSLQEDTWENAPPLPCLLLLHPPVLPEF